MKETSSLTVVFLRWFCILLLLKNKTITSFLFFISFSSLGLIGIIQNQLDLFKIVRSCSELQIPKDSVYL